MQYNIKANIKKYEVKDLLWDTEYFNKKSCQIDIKEKINELDINNIKDIIRKYEFITIINSKKNSFNNNYITSNFNAFLVDVNVSFRKNIKKNLLYINQDNIELKNNQNYNEQLLNLVNGIFKNSRFLNDKNIDINKANKIYVNWVKNSFNKKEKYFITYTLDKKIVAFILFSYKNKYELTIELICVDNDFTFSGIGKRMMRKLEGYAIENGYNTISVGTQIENIDALNFYINLGYNINDIKYIYHLWNLTP